LSNNTEAFFICLGDMPLVNKNIYNDLIKSKNNNKIIVPTYKGEQGNPILFSKTMKAKIMTVQGDSGAKMILQLNEDKVFNFETSNENVVKNFNTIESFNS
jgi:molybdenum cofactor cytidylyltransferase